MARRAALALIACLAGPTSAADIAVDLSSGAVLTATEADAPRYPASLTKLMTAYVAFAAIEAGEIDPDAAVAVSRFAARTPPVKLSLRAGSEIGFTDALEAAVVGSKNDAAVVVAEAVAGSQPAFAERMNAAAARLGMSNTRFINATGLPGTGQQTTARDMALLSRALLSEFPQRSLLFSRRSVTVKGRRVSTTNPLFGRVKGAEGLKTGFTCAAGYAIAALVERENRRILAVTLGHKSKDARLAAARGLIEAAFQLQGIGTPLAPATASSVPPLDVGACSGATAPLVATDISPEERALYAAELAKARQRVVTAPPPPPARVIPQRPALPPPSGWAVFLGAHPSRDDAKRRLATFRARFGRRGVPYIERRGRDGRHLAVIHGLDRATASARCKAAQGYCLVLTPARLLNPRAQWRR